MKITFENFLVISYHFFFFFVHSSIIVVGIMVKDLLEMFKTSLKRMDFLLFGSPCNIILG